MSYKKIFLLLSFIAVFFVSGCGEKVAKEPVTSKQQITVEKELPSVPKAGESVIKAEIPVAETEKEITQEIPPIEQVTTEVVPPSEASAGGSAVQATLEVVEPKKESALKEGELLVADFEGWPNNVGGEMGVYGSLEPDWDKMTTVPYSWVYETTTPGYDPKNVHCGKQSFRLVNALGTKPDETWGSFAMDLGPTTDLTVVPKRVKSLDVSKYKYLTFWARGEKGGEKTALVVRDAHALSYMPQVKHQLPNLTTEWQKIIISLGEFADKLDLTQLDNIGLAFGRDVGNMAGDIAYFDDFIFTNNP